MKFKITKEMKDRFNKLFDKEGFEMGMKPIHEAISSAKTFEQLRRKLGDMVCITDYYDNSTDLTCVFMPSKYSKDGKRDWTSIDVVVTWNFGDPEDKDNEEEGYITGVKLNVLNTQTGQVFHLCSLSYKNYQIYSWLEEPALDEEGCPIFLDGYGEEEKTTVEPRSNPMMEACRKSYKKRIKKSRSGRCNIKKYMIFSWEGLCYSPKGESNENCQIIGCAMATSERAAINKFIKDNGWLRKEGFNQNELSVVRLHDETDIDSVFDAQDWNL